MGSLRKQERKLSKKIHHPHIHTVRRKILRKLRKWNLRNFTVAITALSATLQANEAKALSPETKRSAELIVGVSRNVTDYYKGLTGKGIKLSVEDLKARRDIAKDQPELQETLEELAKAIELFLDKLDKDVEKEIEAGQYRKSINDLKTLIRTAETYNLTDIEKRANLLIREIRLAKGTEIFNSLKVGEVKEVEGIKYLKAYGEGTTESLARKVARSNAVNILYRYKKQTETRPRTRKESSESMFTSEEIKTFIAGTKKKNGKKVHTCILLLSIHPK